VTDKDLLAGLATTIAIASIGIFVGYQIGWQRGHDLAVRESIDLPIDHVEDRSERICTYEYESDRNTLTINCNHVDGRIDTHSTARVIGRSVYGATQEDK
jgi:hypothetical protein